MSTRYIVVTHGPEHSERQRLQAYLYNYATVIARGRNDEAFREVEIVEVETDDPAYHASYQQGRLSSGLFGASVHETYESAVEFANDLDVEVDRL